MNKTKSIQPRFGHITYSILFYISSKRSFIIFKWMTCSATPSVKKFQSFSVNTVAISSCNFEKKDQDMFTMDITMSSYLRNICAVQNKLEKNITRGALHKVNLYIYRSHVLLHGSPSSQTRQLVCQQVRSNEEEDGGGLQEHPESHRKAGN